MVNNIYILFLMTIIIEMIYHKFRIVLQSLVH